MNYDQLLANAPAHDSPEFIEYLRAHNAVLHEGKDWLVIVNAKYGWPTAFLIGEPNLTELMEWYPDAEWRKKPKEKQTVQRFHMHITT